MKSTMGVTPQELDIFKRVIQTHRGIANLVTSAEIVREAVALGWTRRGLARGRMDESRVSNSRVLAAAVLQLVLAGNPVGSLPGLGMFWIETEEERAQVLAYLGGYHDTLGARIAALRAAEIAA